MMDAQVRSTKLQNGLVVLTEHMPTLRSVSLGIWVRRGSRHEPPHLNGICHFIEHALFKGTGRRSALDIAIESDRLGGHFDAYTSHELTGFSLKVVDNSLEKAFDLLSDMVSSPRFDPTDLQIEQKVIIEEIKMVEDSPEEYLSELFCAEYFPEHPLGRPIEGTAKTVSSFNQKATFDYHRDAYTPANLVIAAAGNVDHDRMVELAESVFRDIPSGTQTEFRDLVPRTASPIFVHRKKELEQAHLILATPCPPARDTTRFAANLLTSILGGGTSSRLWQTIREERGLAYSVGASVSSFSDVGIFQIYAGTSPDHLDKVIDLSIGELRKIVNTKVTEDELQLVKEQAISSILLGLESSSVRAGTLARQQIIHGRIVPPEETISKFEEVTCEEIQRVANTYFTKFEIACGILGDLNGYKIGRNRLHI